MDAPLFISSFRRFRRWPKAALFAAVLFAVAELLVPQLWQPSVVGEVLYSEVSPSYNYGYASDAPRLFREGDLLRYYPTENVGIRPFTIKENKPAGTIRIFLFGGSVTRAGGLPLGTAYPELVGSILNERYPDYDWEVINLAVSGFGTARMLNLLPRVLRYHPDALVFHPHGTNEYEDERDARLRDQLHSGLNGLLLRSRVVVLLKKLELRWLGGEEGEEGETAPANAEHFASLVPENRARWMESMVANLGQIACLTESLSLPTIYVGRAERDAESFRGEQVERLNGPISSQPYFLDAAASLTSVVSEYGVSGLFLDWSHYTRTGHRVIAEELCELLRPDGPLFERVAGTPPYSAEELASVLKRCR